MGLLEERIKQDLIQSIFTDSLKTFETIDSKFKLSNDEKSKVLDMVSQFNQELSTLLKNAKLS
jgi:hypothetical protein